MKRTTLAGALCVALAISAMAVAPAAQGSGNLPRDANGVMGGAFTFEVFGYGAYDFIAHGVATGTLKDFGLVKMYTTHQPNPIGDGTLISTAFRIVTASGDEILGTYADAKVTAAGAEGTDYPYDYYYDGKATLVISGGTGQFANARGTITATFFEAIKVFDPYWTEYDCSVAWALEGKVKH